MAKPQRGKRVRSEPTKEQQSSGSDAEDQLAVPAYELLVTELGRQAAKRPKRSALPETLLAADHSAEDKPEAAPQVEDQLDEATAGPAAQPGEASERHLSRSGLQAPALSRSLARSRG